MTEKECKFEYRKYAEAATRRVVYGFIGLVATVAVVIFFVWAILHPHKPRFVLQDVTIYEFNISQPNLLSSNLQVTLSSRNPNDKIGVFYDRLDIYASYRNQEVTSCVLIRYFACVLSIYSLLKSGPTMRFYRISQFSKSVDIIFLQFRNFFFFFELIFTI